MKSLTVILLLITSGSYAQLSLDSALMVARKIQLGTYSYHSQFIGHAGYGAPLILTKDGGAAAFGDTEDKDGKCGMLVKIDKNGQEEWRKSIRPQFDDIESQSVLQDKNGNYYVFLLSYDQKKYRGGTQRIVYLNRTGTVVWDKTIGTYEVTNSPTISYIHLLNDGSVLLRGHVVTEKPVAGQDPKYHYWDGWIVSTGKLTQKSGEIIDWAKHDWEARLKPE